MKTLIFAAVALCLIISGCSGQQPAGQQLPGSQDNAPVQAPGLSFSVLDCDESLAARSAEAAVLGMQWEGSTMVIDAYVATYCGGARINGDYAADESAINLYYSISITGDITRCFCHKRVQYRIEGIESRDYIISIMQK